MEWDQKTIKDAMEVVVNNLIVVGPIAAGAAVGLWWLRGRLAKSEIDGLRAQNEALKERIRLAQEGERAVTKHSEQLTTQIAILKSQLAAQASLDSLATTTSVISSTAFQVVAANKEVELALRLPLAHEPGTRYRIRGPLGDVIIAPDEIEKKVR